MHEPTVKAWNRHRLHVYNIVLYNFFIHRKTFKSLAYLTYICEIMGNRKALISFDEEILKKLDEYAKNEWKGNRSMAIHDILLEIIRTEDEGRDEGRG